MAPGGRHAGRIAAVIPEVGSLHGHGNDEYKAMCARLAAEHGFKVTNPELQDTIEQLRQAAQQADSPRARGAAKTGGGH